MPGIGLLGLRQLLTTLPAPGAADAGADAPSGGRHHDHSGGNRIGFVVV